MPLLQEKDREQVRQMFAELTNPVKLVMFTQEFECDFCKETHDLVQEVAELSDKITAEIHNFALDGSEAEKYGVDKIPAISVVGEKDYGIRYFGIPSGYEFSTVLEAILDVSARESGLSETTRNFLAGLKDPLHIQVFVTPT